MYSLQFSPATIYLNQSLKNNGVKIRKATLKDFKELYKLGLKTTELKVNFSEPFMEAEEFRHRILDKNHIFVQ